ncbi:hypothetical protein JAAARDRAFT_51596 [Jaapia argillacea MUCL 33604]|uniref:Uncharacterized protein n=1 Tax=Jaapia argillacea MUCL 33604 TaxID=933084 RepID=A0A067PGY1_9AGAM|nr:hypothetical protein JAAARDRAFT_51596 [Jaapia argillacea MUCL 33604]
MAMEYLFTHPFFRHSESNRSIVNSDFVVSKVTPNLVTELGFNIFLMLATIKIGGIGGMAVFAFFILETKSRSLEMDIIFGSVSAEQRRAYIERTERALEHEAHDTTSEKSIERKV